jgi:signal transduction histidine kinase
MPQGRVLPPVRHFGLLDNELPVSIQPVSFTAGHRLDKILFWLRWLLLAGVVLLAQLAEDIVLGSETLKPERLWIGLGVGAAGNILIGLLAYGSRLDERMLGLISVMLDSALAGLFFWAYAGTAIPLLILGTLAAFAAAYRTGWWGLFLAILLLTVTSLIAVWQIGNSDDGPMINWGLSLGLLAAFGVFGALLRPGGWLSQSGQGNPDERVNEAQRLRSTRERARAIFEMANTLSATLDHHRVLEEAQNIGMLNLRVELGPDVHLISAVLLFQGEDNKLRVVTSRGLTRADSVVAIPGRRGVLGLALQQGEPVFAGDAVRDPELRYFVAFQDSKSVLAIPLRAGFEVYGVMIFGCDRPDAFTDEHVELMTAIGTQSTLSLQNAVLYQNLRLEKEKIVDVEEDARKKLARDLHDGPTQSVAAIAMRVNYIRRLIEHQPQQALEELWKVEELARRTTKEIRHMLFTLRPLVLETQGLVAALEQLVNKMHETHDLHVGLKTQPDVEKLLDANAQGILFYIVEEAVNNARKHAQAEQIVIRLYRRESNVMVEIEDNGVGFDVGAVDANYDQRGSLGMINMRERTELIEGTLRIQSAKGRGTKITVRIPVHAMGVLSVTDESEPAAPLELQSQRTGVQRSAASASAQPAPAEPPVPLPRPDRPAPPVPTPPAAQPGQPVPGARRQRSSRPLTGSPPRPVSRSDPPRPVAPKPSVSQPGKPVTESRSEPGSTQKPRANTPPSPGKE